MEKKSKVLVWLGSLFILVGVISFSNSIGSVNTIQSGYKSFLDSNENHKNETIKGLNQLQEKNSKKIQNSGHWETFNVKNDEIKDNVKKQADRYIAMIQVESQITSILLFVFSVLCFISAIGLFLRQAWARITAIITVIFMGAVFIDLLSPVYYVAYELKDFCNNMNALNQIYPVFDQPCASDSIINQMFFQFPGVAIHSFFLILFVGILFLLNSSKVKEQFK